MPCLNEAATVAACVRQAFAFLARTGIRGEVLVSDNGSTDQSRELAIGAGARVVNVDRKGYGAALMGGIRAARGRYVVMGDADLSYDFSRLDGFVERLRAGDALVMGNRFKGGVAPGAMPLLHRYLGNPVLSALGRLLFKSPIGDFHCGLRAFQRDAIIALQLLGGGMEFASEMVVKSTLAGLKISEVPTTLSPDGRMRPSHLQTWRDGWRHLTFLLMMSPRWLLLYPGVLLMLVGALAQVALAQGPLFLGTTGLDIHTMLYAAGGTVLGLHLVIFSLLARSIGYVQGVLPESDQFARFAGRFSLEKGVLLGSTLALSGLAGGFYSLAVWAGAGFAELDPVNVMRGAIPSVTLMIGGTEILFASFVLALIGLQSPQRPVTTSPKVLSQIK